MKLYKKTGVLALLLSAVITGCGAGNGQSQAEYIGIDAAKEAALKDAAVSSADASFVTAGLDNRDGTFYYDVEFTADGMEYEYNIDAMTGVVIEKKSEKADGLTTSQTSSGGEESSESTQTQSSSQAATAQASGEVIGEEAAEDAALSHAGVAREEAAFIRSKLERDDGRQSYEVEFYSSDNTEYNYDIDAVTGEVISYELEARGNGKETQPARQDTYIGEEQAGQIALEQVPGSTESNMRIKLERDDGKIFYEGTIIYNETKYEFEIDAYSGTILEWNSESVYD